MVFKSKQDSLLTCRDQKCEKKPFLLLKIAFVINRNWSWMTITSTTERLLYNETKKLYKCLNKGCPSTSTYKRSIQRHLKECYNYTKPAEAMNNIW